MADNIRVRSYDELLKEPRYQRFTASDGFEDSGILDFTDSENPETPNLVFCLAALWEDYMKDEGYEAVNQMAAFLDFYSHLDFELALTEISAYFSGGFEFTDKNGIRKALNSTFTPVFTPDAMNVSEITLRLAEVIKAPKIRPIYEEKFNSIDDVEKFLSESTKNEPSKARATVKQLVEFTRLLVEDPGGVYAAIQFKAAMMNRWADKQVEEVQAGRKPIPKSN